MGYDGLTTEYLCYMMNRIGLEAEGDDGYLRLCETLQEIEFIPQTAMDENRSSECIEIRKDFAEHEYAMYGSTAEDTAIDILDEIYGDNGTMFELLTVLAEKMAFEMYDSQYEASTRKWFTEMLCNCGIIDQCTNEAFEKEGTEETIRDTMDSVIFRRTGWDGEGGLFPLSYPQYDQRKVELIIQMNNYLEENYDI